VGLVGCGTIGTALAKALTRQPLSKVARVVALHDGKVQKARSLACRLNPHPPVLSMAKLVGASQWVVEAASPSAVRPLLQKVIVHRRDLMVMSTAGLLESPGLLRQARKADCRISVPSGAVVGIDGLKALSGAPIRTVTLTTRKPPRSFGLFSLRRPKLLFSGSARQAVRRFPLNVNVAATVILAGVPLSRFRVALVADPSVSRNIHELSVEGRDGRLLCRTENLPSENPKTSRLAVLSAVRTLKDLFDSVRIGT